LPESPAASALWANPIRPRSSSTAAPRRAGQRIALAGTARRDVFGPLQQGPRPSNNGGHCYGYETRSLTEGLGDITLSTDEPGFYWSAWYDAFAGAHGQFLSSRAEGCRGSWQLTLAPEAAPAQGELISPLDAGSGRAWIIERTIQVAQAQFCDGTFTVAGYLSCADRFIVASVTEEMVP
jgi:hypothetical protein